MTLYYSKYRFPVRVDFFNAQSGKGSMTWDTSKLQQVHAFFQGEKHPLSIEVAQREFSMNAAREDTPPETSKLHSEAAVDMEALVQVLVEYGFMVPVQPESV